MACSQQQFRNLIFDLNPYAYQWYLVYWWQPSKTNLSVFYILCMVSPATPFVKVIYHLGIAALQQWRTDLSSCKVFFSGGKNYSKYYENLEKSADCLKKNQINKQTNLFQNNFQPKFFDLKWHVPTAFSSPRAQPEVVVVFWFRNKLIRIDFLVSNESPYFSHYNPKISASNSLPINNVPISDIPILIFLCIFITASSPMSHSYFCPRREIRISLVVRWYKMCLRGQGHSDKNENTQVKIGTCSFNFG